MLAVGNDRQFESFCEVAGAAKLLGEDSDPTDCIRRGFLSAYARLPTNEEQARALLFLEQYQQALEQEGAAAERRAELAWSALARSLMASNELMYIE